MGLTELGAGIQRSPLRCDSPSAVRWQRLTGDTAWWGRLEHPLQPDPGVSPAAPALTGMGLILFIAARVGLCFGLPMFSYGSAALAQRQRLLLLPLCPTSEGAGLGKGLAGDG